MSRLNTSLLRTFCCHLQRANSKLQRLLHGFPLDKPRGIFNPYYPLLMNSLHIHTSSDRSYGTKIREKCNNPEDEVSSSESTDTDTVLKMRYVFVTCCDEFWDIVPNGLTFDVCYMDSHPGAAYSTSQPVIVGVHGAPGSHHQLIPLLQSFVCKGYRVILPDLPGFGYTRGLESSHDDCYTYSPEENANLLAGFLTVLGIPSVDLAVGHSAGCQTILELCSEYKGVKSSFLINPTVHKPYRGIQPIGLLQKLSQGWDVPMLRPLIKAFVYLGALPMGFYKIPPVHIINSIKATADVDFENVIHNMTNLKHTNLPSCVVYSENDPRIEKASFEEFVEMMGVHKDRVCTYTSDTPSQERVDYPAAVCLIGGGHYPLKKYCNVLTVELQKLLDSLR